MFKDKVRGKQEEAAGLPINEDPWLGAVYEYKRIQVSGGKMAEFLSEHGQFGWRLSHVDQVHLAGTGGAGPYWILMERKVR